MMELFGKIFNNPELLTIFTKSFIIDVWQGLKVVLESIRLESIILLIFVLWRVL